MLKQIGSELKSHAPFTILGTGTGIVIMVVLVYAHASPGLSRGLFWTFHPLHVLLSALVTSGMYVLHAKRSWWKLVLVGYLGSVAIATLSDSVMPYVGECLLDIPNRGVHLGFIEKWWLVNPLALIGIVLACRFPRTKIPHAGHVLLSTWASLFHMTMAFGSSVDSGTIVLSAAFLFLAVWVPCCTSDIVFPLVMAGTSKEQQRHGPANGHPHEVHSRLNRWRLPRPLTRFLGWWASVFALLGPFSVCPFCGQPGCGIGAGAAGVLGGFVAALMTFPKYLGKLVTRHRCGNSERAS